MSSRSKFTLMSAIFGLVSILILAPALYFAYNSWSFKQSAQEAPGEVIAMQGYPGHSIRPVVAYRVRGEPYELIGEIASSPPAFDIGEKVTVLYQEENPANARIDSFLELWFLTALLGGLGVVFAIPALILGGIRLLRH